MKKWYRIFLRALPCAILALGMSGCACKHEQINAAWSMDDTHHWHTCQKEDCTEMIDKAEHTWDQGTDAADVVTYTCTECGKTRDLSLLSSVYAKAPHTYYCKDGSVLYTLSDSSLSDFNGLCQQYEIAGHAVYSESDKNGNRFTTYTKGAAMAHISFYPSKKVLNIAVSNTAGATLPPKNPAVTDGDYPCPDCAPSYTI